MRLLCIDPGFAKKSGCGYAYFRDGDMERLGVVQTEPSMPIRERARMIWLAMWAGGDQPGQHVPYNLEGCRVDRIVVELPRIYPFSKQKGDPNDIVDLAYLAGALDQMGPEGVAIHPRSWKGNVPKDVMGRRILGKLKPDELALVEKITGERRHNAIDAAGLGLHDLGRLR